MVLARKRRDMDADQPPQTPQPQRRSRRKSSVDVKRERLARARASTSRPVLVAQWAGLVVAESDEYEFLDGRFFFPAHHVRWEKLEESDKDKFINPIGRASVYDIVLRSESARRAGRIISRNKGAVISLKSVKRNWSMMQGYTYFWKGVRIFHKPASFSQKRLLGVVKDADVVGGTCGEEDLEWKFENGLAMPVDDWGGNGDAMSG